MALRSGEIGGDSPAAAIVQEEHRRREEAAEIARQIKEDLGITEADECMDCDSSYSMCQRQIRL
jgi:hypothetical protein